MSGVTLQRAAAPMVLLAAAAAWLVADASQSTSWRWTAGAASVIAVGVSLVSIAKWAPRRIGLALVTGVSALSLAFLVVSALVLTGLWSSPGQRQWDEPMVSVIGATVALVAMGASIVVCVKAWRSRIRLATATVIAQLLCAVAALGCAFLLGSTSTLTPIPTAEIVELPGDVIIMDQVE